MDDEREIIDIAKYFVGRYGPAAAALMDSRATACEREGDPEAGRLWRRVGDAIRAAGDDRDAWPSRGARRDGPVGDEQVAVPDSDIRLAFEATPHAYLLLTPDLRIADANDAYLGATMTRRGDIIGRGLFETFPDNPEWADADGVRNLGASLARVIERGQADRMGVQRYDVRRPDGAFEERWWSTLNTPAFDADGRLVLIIHHPQEVRPRGRGRA